MPKLSNTTNKKTGRKPKGGKLISKSNISVNNDPALVNIILHLKCSFNDLDEYNDNYNKQLTNPLLYNPVIPPNIKTYNTHSYFNYENLNGTEQTQENLAYIIDNVSSNNSCSIFKTIISSETEKNSQFQNSYICEKCYFINDISVNTILQHNSDNGETTHNNEYMNEPNITEINQKLKTLKLQLFKNKLNDKKSACFWCTYDFDNNECYIPLQETDGNIYGYGSFCRPECAVAYLMKEQIDDSTKFDRYNLINQLYGKIYNYKKNIKPAPNPYYLLNKYYGNLSIQEYRKLLKSEHLLMIIDKPLTRVLPELHENNEEINQTFNNINNNSQNMGNETQYKVKKNTDKKNTKNKTNIIREHFGLS
jgi:hypothetical protein